MKRVVLVPALLLCVARLAWAVVNCSISGTVTNIDGTNCVNCTINFNSLVTQTIQSVTYQPLLTSTTTDANGNMTAISLPQGLSVQVTVSEKGQSFTPYSAIVPFLSSATFNQLNQGISTNPLNVLASNQPPTGPLSMNNQKITTLLCPTVANDALAWGCSASVANLTVTGTLNQSGTSGENYTGLLTVSQIATPSAPVVTAVGQTGSTNYNYYVVCHDSNGGTTVASAAGNISNANATLSGTNYDSVAFTLPTKAVNCDILRGDTSHSCTGGLAVTTSPFLDQNNATNAYTAPTRNTTGDGQFAGALSAGTVATGIQTGDISASRSATTGQFLFGSNGSQTFDFGITNGGKFTLVGGQLVAPSLSVTGNETVGGTLAITGATTLTGGLNTPLAIAQGGNGTASPGLTAGTGITLGSSWPTQSIATNAAANSLIPHGQQLFTSSGTFTVPANVYSFVAECWGGGGGGGGYGTGFTTGGTGGTTSIGTVCSSPGGSGGVGVAAGSSALGGNGGATPTNGNLLLRGAVGFAGNQIYGVFGGGGRGAIAPRSGDPETTGAGSTNAPGGGGDGGGNAALLGGGGGGSGSYSEGQVTTTPTTQFTVTIGAAGTAGTGGTQNGIVGQAGQVLVTW